MTLFLALIGVLAVLLAGRALRLVGQANTLNRKLIGEKLDLVAENERLRAEIAALQVPPSPAPVGRRRLRSTDSTAAELRRCLYSTLGGLEAICEHIEPGPYRTVLRAMIEAGYPEMFPLAHTLCGDNEVPEKSFARGYQVTVLSAREEESGRREPAAWQEDPDRFVARSRAEVSR